jgi:hypothetical protein
MQSTGFTFQSSLLILSGVKKKTFAWVATRRRVPAQIRVVSKCRASPKSGVSCRSLDLRSQTWDQIRNWDRRIKAYVSARPGLPRKWVNAAHDKRFRQPLLGSAISELCPKAAIKILA